VEILKFYIRGSFTINPVSSKTDNSFSSSHYRTDAACWCERVLVQRRSLMSPVTLCHTSVVHSTTGVLWAHRSTVPGAPPIRLPIPNPNPKTHPNTDVLPQPWHLLMEHLDRQVVLGSRL